MRIVYIVRTGLHLYPPCLSQIQILKKLGNDVLVIFGDCNRDTLDLLRKNDIKTFNLKIKRSKNALIGKIQSYVNYKKRVKAFLSENYKEGDIIWYGTADSCFAIGKSVRKYPYILNVLELYDNNRMYLRGVKKVIIGADAVVACEETRADIMKMWWNLKKRPYVMPNKPYNSLVYKDMLIPEKTKKVLDELSNKKIILYQGIITADRDLSLLADALRTIDMGDLYLVLMGKELTHSVESLKNIYPRTIYLGFISPPFHLAITKRATVGVAYYGATCLNNLFCAPNKIYEYSESGLPILCNDIPGLRNTVGFYGAGECVDFDKKEDLLNAIIKIINDCDFYSCNSKRMYQSVDNVGTVKDIITDVANNRGLE